MPDKSAAVVLLETGKKWIKFNNNNKKKQKEDFGIQLKQEEDSHDTDFKQLTSFLCLDYNKWKRSSTDDVILTRYSKMLHKGYISSTVR